MNNIPALPSIEGDLILDVLTRQPHRDRMSPPDNSEHGGVERLAGLGESVLDMVVVYTLFQQRPFLSATQLSVCRRHHAVVAKSSPPDRKNI
jgi:hypothetical protein